MSEEQGYIDEMVRTRSTRSRASAVGAKSPLDGDQAGGAQTVDPLPPVEKVSGGNVHYQAARRTQGISDSGTLALHDATEDGIPICAVDWQDVYKLTETSGARTRGYSGRAP